MLADLAAQVLSIRTVALYDTLGPEAAEFILKHSDVSCVFTTMDKVARLLALSNKCPLIKLVIVMDAIEGPSASMAFETAKGWAVERGISLYQLRQVEELGTSGSNKRILTKPTASDIFSICYTSGTYYHGVCGLLQSWV
jgi:long-chain acyl-CoA synthetase